MSNVRPHVRVPKTQTTAISVKVKPNARVSLLERIEGGTWVAQLKSPPVDGKANEELLALVAGHFGCRKSAVSLKSGASARTKLVRVEGSIPVLQNVA
jgi:uncharacterized protein YggU (UPF0235/DUF167 family)